MQNDGVKPGFKFTNKTRTKLYIELRTFLSTKKMMIYPGDTGEIETVSGWFAIEMWLALNDKVTDEPNLGYQFTGKNTFAGVGYFGDYFADKMLVGDCLNYQTAVHIPELRELQSKLKDSWNIYFGSHYSGGLIGLTEKPSYEIIEGLYFNANAHAQLVTRKLKIRKTNTVGNEMMKESKTKNI